LATLLRETNYVAGRGKKVLFHGAFATKARAKRKEKAVGGYIEKKKIKGQTRYMVLTRR
jgi:hypothetical protein